MIIYNFFKYLILSIQYNRILGKAIREENILHGLSIMLGTELSQDWIGRIYGVVNPYVKDGKFDPESIVTELGKDVPSEMAIEKFIMERLLIAQQFIRANNLFDLLTYEIKKLDDYENYLFIMEPIPYAELFTWAKRLGWLMLGLIGIGVICAILFMVL